MTKCYFLFNLGYCKGKLEESGRKVGGEGGGGGRGGGAKSDVGSTWTIMVNRSQFLVE